jgi:hypothetical protein
MKGLELRLPQLAIQRSVRQPLLDSRDRLGEVTTIFRGGEGFRPVLHEANDLPADDREERDRLGGLRSVRDADLVTTSFADATRRLIRNSQRPVVGYSAFMRA